jgi:UDP-glucose 4-epimerase
MVLPRFVSAAVQNKPINVFGDGSQSRVFCHVDDVVRAIIAIAKNDTTIGEVFNIGGDYEITILGLAELVIEQCQSRSPIVFVSYDDVYSIGFEDTIKRVPNTAKIRTYIGWQPKITILKKSIISISRT